MKVELMHNYALISDEEITIHVRIVGNRAKIFVLYNDIKHMTSFQLEVKR